MIAFAFSIVFVPEQIDEGDATGDKTGLFPTVTVTVVVPGQPNSSIPVTVYVVVVGGMAVTFGPDVDDNPVEGDQLYVVAPMADKETDIPPGLQIKELDGLTDIGGGMQSGLAVFNKSPADEVLFFVSLILSFCDITSWLNTTVLIIRKNKENVKRILICL